MQPHAYRFVTQPISPLFYVVTGGPGSGKTTLLAELARRGHLCIPEDARAIIQEQVASGGSAVPWADARRFAELLMRQSILTWEEQAAKHSRGPIYFDRGVGDAFTCADLVGCTPPADLREQARACRYRNPVFLAPWWPEIYSTDMERRQTTEEAERTEQAVVKTYTELGYRIVRLPLASPVVRADFVLRHSARV
jgi:predicted ATPase